MSTSNEGVSGHNSSTSNRVTTTFADDGLVVSESFVSPIETVPIPRADKSLESFFRKEVQVFNGTWPTTTAPNVSLYSVDITTLANSAIYAAKSSGFGLLRGTACFKTIINATPFHCGKLGNFWLPMAAQAEGPAYAAMHNTTLTCRMQLPHLELDCRESTSEFRIPYMTPTHFYPILNDVNYPSYGWGSFDLAVLSPLGVGSGADQSISVSVFVWFEDMELEAPLRPQADTGGAKKKRSVRSFGKSVTQKEAASAGVGTISSGLKSVSMASSALAAVPMFAPVAGPLSWVADVGAGVASAFGWEKPDLNPAPNIMVKQYNRFLATSDGVDSAIPLALKTNHGVTPSAGYSIRSEDEMSFSFLKGIETVTNADVNNTIYWTDLAGPGAVLLTYKVAPVQYISPTLGGLYSQHTRTVGGHTATYNCGPPVWYLATKFKQYRGSLKLRLKFPKTDFHTGRLVVCWTPGHYVTTAPTLTTGQYSLREIIDLRDGNEFCFTLPYISEFNYLDCEQYYGQVDIFVQSMLVRPDACASQIQMLTYWSANEDFELAVPAGENAYGFNDTPFSPEMDSTTSGTERVVCEAVGGINVPPFTAEAAEQSIGELFTDIKQLLGRYTNVNIKDTEASSATNAQLMIWPYFCNVAYINTTIQGFGNGGDAYSFFAPMYAFYRGDMRIAISQSRTSTSAPELVTNDVIFGFNYPRAILTQTKAITTAALSNITDNLRGPLGSTVDWRQQWYTNANYTRVPSIIGMGITEAGIGFSNWKIPYYAPTKCSAIFPASSVREVPQDKSKSVGTLILSATTATWTDYKLFRSVADEFHFHFFLGAPPLLVYYV